MGRGRRRLWIELGIWLIVGATAFTLTFQFDDPIQGYRLGATAWPRAIILAMLAVAVLQFAVALRRAPAADATAARRTGSAQPPAAGRRPPIKVLLAFGLPLLYVLLLPRTGFYLTTPVFLAAYLYLLGERRWRRLLAVAAIIYAIMIAVFTATFYVPLPVGNWAYFYDINNWLLETIR